MVVPLHVYLTYMRVCQLLPSENNSAQGKVFVYITVTSGAQTQGRANLQSAPGKMVNTEMGW